MNSERLRQITDRFSEKKIAVIGDFFLDKYLEVDNSRSGISLETGRKVHQVVNIRCSPGAAGNVVNNLAALRAFETHAIGFIGDDGEGYDLTRQLNSLGCITDGLLRVSDRVTPTYLKPRDMDIPGLEGEHERYDTKNRIITSPEIEKKIIEVLDSLLDKIDAVMIVDQDTEKDCGVITHTIRKHLISRAKKHPDVLFFVDSRSNAKFFQHIIIKSNRYEVMGIENPDQDTIVSSESLCRKAEQLRAKTQASLFITLGSEGMLVFDPEEQYIRGVNIHGPVDSTGAGDSAAAGIVMALISGATSAEAALIGNLAASVTIQQIAVCGTCRPDELFSRLDMWHRQGNEG